MSVPRSCPRIFSRMAADSAAESRAVPGRFSHSPVSPRGQKIRISSTGKISTVVMEMICLLYTSDAADEL